MLLAIDVGNTNIVFAVFDGQGKVQGEWRISTDGKRTADEYGVWLTQLLDWNHIDCVQISDVIISSVVPATIFNLKRFCKRYFDCDALVVGEEGLELGIDLLLDRPEEVGADRLVNGIAAHLKHEGPLIIIDFGTATTFDVINEKGQYCGGAIAPGINLSIEALHMAAAKLPRVTLDKPKKIIGTNTVEAMQSGIFWGYVSMLEGMVMRIKGEFGMTMKVIATGGLAPIFADASKIIQFIDPDITLRGLWEIHKRNRS